MATGNFRFTGLAISLIKVLSVNNGFDNVILMASIILISGKFSSVKGFRGSLTV